jgi:hypothetical protein
MLNAALVEQLGSINRNRKSGVLTVVGNGFRLRFCIQDGDPVALDFCADKELLLARALLEFHKIGQELYQLVVTARETGKDTVTGMVRRHQAANEDEIGLVTRAMVEDTLVRAFGSIHYEMSFDEQEGIDSFDFDTTAVRLRISATVLLSTVQARVAEIDKVVKEVGGGHSVFTLAESEGGTAPLTEYEKHVLNFIDGQRTVEDIAIAFRENTLNMSRLIGTLMSKGVVRRSPGASTRLQEAVQAPAVPLAPDHAPEAEPAPAPAVRRPVAHPQPSMGLIWSLAGVAILVLIVWLLMLQWHGRNAALESASQALNTHILTKNWADALAQIDESRRIALNDLEAIRRVDELKARLTQALQAEYDAIDKLITEQDFAQAQRRIAALPADDRLSELKRRVQAGEASFKISSDDVRERVMKLLDNGNVTEAMALISGSAGKIGSSGNDYLDRWRLATLERASSATAPLSQRVALINQLKASHPTPRQLEKIDRISADFSVLEKRSREQIARLQIAVDKGAYDDVASEIERLHLIDQTRGTSAAALTEALSANSERIRNLLTSLYDQAMDLVKNSDDGKAMLAASATVQETLVKYPLASNASQLQLASQLLSDAAGLITERTANDEAASLDGWLQEHQPRADLAAVIKVRAARLRAIETAADDALTNGRAFVQENDWDQAQRTFDSIIERKEWLHTSARPQAEREIEDLKVAHAKQLAWQEDLNRAMISGDVTECYKIQQKMGLKYLPLLVMSIPSGASVFRDGTQVGTTPFKLDIPAGERTSLSLEMRKQGFVTKTVPANLADAGWLLHVDLEREAAARYDLAMTITSPPTALDGKIWVANRQTAVVLSTQGKPERVAIDPNGLIDSSGQPLYAAPMASGDAVYYGTREGIAIKCTAHGIERLPLSGRTDFAIAVFNSQLVQGRRLLIVAGMDGVLHAGEERSAAVAWSGISGEPFSASPQLIGDQVLTVRRNGHIEIYQADDGSPSGQYDLGEPTIAAWPTAAGMAGLTASSLWTCALTGTTKAPLPQQAALGGEDVFLTSDNHVFVHSGDAWKDLGRFEGKLSGQPRRWGEMAVLPLGSTLVVEGAHGFRVASSGTFLSSALLGDSLVVASSDGTVLFFSPP